jgi:signal transduction histidine kinase
MSGDAMLLAMSEQTRTGIGAVALAAGTALAVGLGSFLIVQGVARRNRVAASWLTPISVVLTVGAGVLVSARAMVLDAAQVTIMVAVLAVTATIAVAFGLTLAREVRRAEQHHAEAEARRQRDAQIEAQRRELFSWMSHDLRTPLARMKAITEALGDGVAPDPQRYVRQLDQQVDVLAVLVDDLLALSRLSDPASPVPRQRVDLADLASDALSSCSPQARAQGVALTGGADPGLVVSANPTDLNRALHNLLDNALRHTPAGGTVRLTCTRDGPWAAVRVADQCGGIRDDALPHLFEPGWRGDAARTPGDDRGSGLGLAIVRHVALQHGGTVDAGNTDIGCAFTLRIPAAADDVDRGAGVVTGAEAPQR